MFLLVILVTSGPVSACITSSAPLSVSAQSGYLSSWQLYGGTSCSIFNLQAGPGQRWNITLLDFAIASPILRTPADREMAADARASVCRKYAIIREHAGSGNDITPQRSGVNICGGDRRQKNVYMSKSNSLTVQLFTPQSGNQAGHFLIKYQGELHQGKYNLVLFYLVTCMCRELRLYILLILLHSLLYLH